MWSESKREAIAFHAKHAQELANKNGRSYAVVEALHKRLGVVHLRPHDEVGENERTIAVFRPDVPKVEEKQDLPGLHDRDFDYWMEIVSMVWYLVRKFSISLERVEPEGLPMDCAPARWSEDNIVLQIAVRQTKDGKWFGHVTSWKRLIPEIAQRLAQAKKRSDEFVQGDFCNIIADLEAEAWMWVNKHRHAKASSEDPPEGL